MDSQAKKHWWLHGAIPIFLSLVGLALNVKAYYPGFISPDSLDQYTQAYTQKYSDWHPPIMAGFWHLLLYIHEGGAAMFMIQIMVFWLSFFLLFKTSLNHMGVAAWLVPIFFFAPFMQNFVGNIWKDVGLAISWLLAIVIMIRSQFEKRTLTKLESAVCFILLCYGCWIRINALPGVLPLLGMYIYVQRKNFDAVPKTGRLIWQIVAMGLLVVGLQISITKIFLKPINTHPEYKLFLHDLTGIYKESGDFLFPKEISDSPGFDSAYVRKKYIYSTFDNIWWNSDNKQIVPNASESDIEILRNSWMKAILKHPFVYLKNRSIGFLEFLRIKQSGSELAIHYQYIHPNDFGLSFEHNRLTNLFYKYVEKQRRMPYMQPWFWLLLNLVLLVMAHMRKFGNNNYLVLFLAYSSLFYLSLEYIVFQADTEFRYFYWNCMAISLACILAIGSRKKAEVVV